LLVRTWNVFHGNSVPPQRRAFLEEMVRLITRDGPDIVCLQELPLWSLERLADWSGMTAIGDVAQRAWLGPIPSTPELGRRITSLNHGLLRSAFAGQANAILLARGLRVVERHVLVLNSRRFRRVQAEWLRLGPLARLAWARERRVCQAVRVRASTGLTLFVANLHATSYPPDERLADAEVMRAATFVDALAEPEEVCLIAGDLNVSAERSWTLRDLLGPDWGFALPGPWIDHVLVRNAARATTVSWQKERRMHGDVVLSDHAPVEVTVE
jgi:endonuclease/exonuclease/phosphatase family metal-dependent hydrolase